MPMTILCQKYAVSDVALKKVCKALDVPTPPLGYWAKIYAGQPHAKPPLPKSTKPDTKQGARGDGSSSTRSYRETKGKDQDENESYDLSFMSEMEKEDLLLSAGQIELPDIRAKAKSQIVKYKPIITEWKKQDRKDALAQRTTRGKHYWQRKETPFLAEYVSEKSLPRIYQILGALISAVESSNGSVSSSLDFYIRDELVPIEITESQTRVDHVLTKEEMRLLRDYDLAKSKGKYAYEPSIKRKYDYVFNGILTLIVSGKHFFKESTNQKIEDRLSDVFISMYDASEDIRIARMAREEEIARRKEEEQICEEKRLLYNEEVEKLDALHNLVDDFETANKIRNYLNALKSKTPLSEEEKDFIVWAKNKADWYDPTIGKIDEMFGKRKHESSGSVKEIKKRYHYG